MRKRGFTLIELLAVIVVIVIIVLISIPIITGIITNARKGALKNSAYGLSEAASMYYAKHMDGIEDYIDFEIIKNEQSGTEKLSYKGKIDTGYVRLTQEGKVALCIDNGKYYAVKNLNNSEVQVSDGVCSSEYDEDIMGYVTIGSASYIGLRLDVKAYESKAKLPNKANEGYIGVITDKKITDYYVTPTSPIEPKEGTIWVVLNNTATNYIITKNSKIGVSYVLQYVESKWVLKEAYVYNNLWIQLGDYENSEYLWEYNYTGEYQTFTAPYSGYYQVEAWGASGGAYNVSYPGGKGAYTKGDLYLNSGEKLYIYVGQAGTGGVSKTWTSWNGGTASSQSSAYGSATGGGATDIRINSTSSSTAWNETESLRTRIMVAAGGGAGYYYSLNGTVYRGNGGDAGGLIGYNGTTNYNAAGVGATQTSGGTYTGSFGIGGSGATSSYSSGGSGWYGGGGGYHVDGSGGGSSYISGHEGCNSINIFGRHIGSAISYTGKYFLNTKMIDGQGFRWYTSKKENVGTPTHDGSTVMTGNSGNGYAKITFKSFDSINSNEYIELGNSIEKLWQFPYLGYYQEFTVPKNGTYKIELWGASGGAYSASYPGGKGAYTKGNIALKAGDKLYIYVGEIGTGGLSKTWTSWNGGTASSQSSAYGSATGGGATDIRISPTSSITTWKESDSLKTRIMVAAGGGGGYYFSLNGTVYRGNGGAAGGLIGYNGTTNYNTAGVGATQTSGGTYTGSFGVGGSGATSSYSSGGSGWYGGGGGYHVDGAGGGSSYISGHAGCIGITENGNPLNSAYTKIDDSYSLTGYKFTDTLMIDGEGHKWTTEKVSSIEQMPSYDKVDTMIGNSGNGYAKITFVK